MLRQRSLTDRAIDKLLSLHGIWRGLLSPLARHSFTLADFSQMPEATLSS